MSSSSPVRSVGGLLVSGLLLSGLLVSPRLASAQMDGVWTTFLNANEVNDIVAVGESVYAATSGGALRLDPDGSFTQWNREAGGILSDSLQTVDRAQNGEIWFGTARVGISILDPAAERWSSFTSLLQPIPGDRILASRFDTPPQGDEALLVGTETGYAVFVDGNQRFICQLGIDICTIPSYVVTDLIYWEGDVWLATAEGAASQGSDGTWTDRSAGLNGRVLRRFAVFGDQLLGAAEGPNTGVFSWDGTAWTRFDSGLPNRFEAQDFLVAGPDLWIAGTGGDPGVFRFSIKGWERVGDEAESFSATSLARTESGRIFAGATDVNNEVRDGIWEWNGSSWEQHRVAGPPLRAFYRSLTVDEDDQLWFSTADRSKVPLIGRFDGSTWETWDGGVGGATSAWTWDMVAHDGELFLAHCCCSTGDNCVLESFNTESSAFVPLEGIQEVWKLDRGPDDSIWATTRNNDESRSKGIYRIDPRTGTSETFNSGNIPILNNQNSAIEATTGRVWIGNASDGLVVWELGANGRPDTLQTGSPECNDFGAVDDRFLCYRAADGGNTIIGDSIVEIEEGPDGKVWIGTTQGLSIFEDGAFTNITPQFNRFPTGEVLALAPSPDGGAWVATAGAGLTRMVPNGSGAYTYTNYQTPPLPNVNIRALAVSRDGRSVWCGTERGLAKFTPFAQGAGGDAGDLAVFPNPFEPGCHEGVRLLGAGGLADGVVIDLSGRVVSRFEGADASTPLWDGRVDGKLAAPGLYIVQVRSGQGIENIGLGIIEGLCGQ